jgi:hypothetical protein
MARVLSHMPATLERMKKFGPTRTLSSLQAKGPAGGRMREGDDSSIEAVFLIPGVIRTSTCANDARVAQR